MTTPARTCLEVIDIPSPCPADWNAMKSVAGDRVRLCKHCEKHVFNLSDLTREAAEQLVSSRATGDEHFCVRMVRRVDGTVVTSDCHGKWRRCVTRLANRWGGLIGASCSLLLAIVGCDDAPPTATMGTPPVITLQGMVAASGRATTEPATQPADHIMGKMRAPSPATTECSGM